MAESGGSNTRDEMAGTAAASDDVIIRSRGHFITTNTNKDDLATQSNEFSNVETCILEHLHRDILACDVQLSLFIGAARSYRHDSSLSPFPEFYLDASGNKDIRGIHEAIAAYPSLTELKVQLEKRQCNLSVKQLTLLAWIFEGGPAKLSLRSLKQCNWSDTLRSMGIEKRPNYVMPNHILEVSKKDTDRWITKSEGEETFHGFHGSRLDNWFSILNNGLQQHRSKTSKFGEGIYLSSDLTLSMNYSTRGVGWEKSVLGSTLSCISINQVINHQNVKIHSSCPMKGQVEDSEGGSIPEHHILVRDNQLLHARYLMVYCGNKKAAKDVNLGHQNSDVGQPARSRLATWLASNKMLLVLICYGILLALVGITSSTWFKRLVAKYF